MLAPPPATITTTATPQNDIDCIGFDNGSANQIFAVKLNSNKVEPRQLPALLRSDLPHPLNISNGQRHSPAGNCQQATPGNRVPCCSNRNCNLQQEKCVAVGCCYDSTTPTSACFRKQALAPAPPLPASAPPPPRPPPISLGAMTPLPIAWLNYRFMAGACFDGGSSAVCTEAQTPGPWPCTTSQA
jgi:hypothetical protein